MRIRTRFICDRCGAEFPDHGSCLSHERACGEYPMDGLYTFTDGGSTAFMRVDSGDMTMRVTVPYPFRTRQDSLATWGGAPDLKSITDAQAVMEIHSIFSGYEDATLRSLRLPPFDREVSP